MNRTEDLLRQVGTAILNQRSEEEGGRGEDQPRQLLRRQNGAVHMGAQNGVPLAAGSPHVFETQADAMETMRHFPLITPLQVKVT